MYLIFISNAIRHNYWVIGGWVGIFWTKKNKKKTLRIQSLSITIYFNSSGGSIKRIERDNGRIVNG